MSAFHAYDIRGIYNEDFNLMDVYRIGYCLPTLLKADMLLVGRDARESSPVIFDTLTRGIMDAGCDVLDMGLATTPAVYFGTAHFGFAGSVMITASHNSKEYNGMKISGPNGKPIGYDNGLKELEEMVKNTETLIDRAQGVMRTINVMDPYLQFLEEKMPQIGNLRLTFDCSNGMAGLLLRDLFGTNFNILNEKVDCTFPNHEPNPLDINNVKQLMQAVKDNHSDLGIIYDGDADRVMFVDEKGEYIPADFIIALLGTYYAQTEEEGIKAVQDIRTSRSVTEYLESIGIEPHCWKVGHVYAKAKIAELNAVFGGELAGHYYFREFWNCDSGFLTTLIVLRFLNDLKAEGKTISSFIDQLRVYANSGEVNFKIEKKAEAMEALKDKYQAENPTKFMDFDGYRIEFKDWWFNVRPSNTEPYLRLVVEARTQELLDEKLAEIKGIIESFA